MADQQATPRRVRVERNIYRRTDGGLELGYRDSDGRRRWKTLGPIGIKQARAERDFILGARGMGERVAPSPRLRFGEAAERWMAGPVADLRPSTHAAYTYALAHALKRWQRRRLDPIRPDDCVRLVRELRAEGLRASYIGSVLGGAHQVFRYARRHLSWHGSSPVGDLLRSERPRTGSPERRVYHGHELAQTIAAADEPWATLFRLAAVVGARMSELLGLWWGDLVLDNLGAATITVTHQVDRRGVRVPLKTEESKATLPLPRATALMLLEHRAAQPTSGRARSCSRVARAGRSDSATCCARSTERRSERAMPRAADVPGPVRTRRAGTPRGR